MRLFCLLIALAGAVLAGQSQNSAELSSRDEPAEFKTRVNLVTVPVVVRDAQGRAVGNLHKDDFQLLDRGKPQVISKFEMETPGQLISTPPADTSEEIGAAPGSAIPAAPVIPQRYVAYLFDDVHTTFSDLARTRDAASRHILATLSPVDRAAVYTISGQGNLDFTDDKTKLQAALMQLRPRPIARNSAQQCPDVSYYMADQIINKNDATLLQALIQEAIDCLGLRGDPGAQQIAQTTVQGTATEVLHAGDQETHVAWTVIREVVRRISALPGQRMIILTSGGFLTLDEERFEESEVLERAVHSGVIINTLDARGLYTDSEMDASRSISNIQSAAVKSSYMRTEASLAGASLAELADGTGGQFVENTNDLDGGFRRLGSPPEYIYILGFVPENLKNDGSFHRLKVTVKPGMKLSLQARRGYYAPKHAVDPVEAAKQEIADALFSQEQVRDLPVQLHTQFFKSSETDAKLSVMAHLDLKGMQFRKADGRNNDELTIVAGLFDNNGNFLKGTEKKLTLHLLDRTLASHLQSGFTVRTSFDVKPGSYLVRLVVREAGGQQMAAQSGSVEIP